jgi:glyoxylate reductase
MKTVVVTRAIPEVGLALLKKHKRFRTIVSPHDRVLKKAELIKIVHGADVILSLLTDTIDGDVMDAAGPQLKLIANYAVGFNNIDVDAAKKRGILVSNTPAPLLTQNVAEHTIALMLALTHHIVEADAFTRAGKYKGWAPLLMLGTLVKGKTLGIIGLGRIGSEVAMRAVNGLGMQVAYTNLKRDVGFEKKFSAKYKRNLHSLLKISDIITVHVPLVKETKHLINTAAFASMKKGAFLVNTARGPIVSEKALLRALKSGKLGGAALDVFECEPSIDCDVTDHLALKEFSNVILTPHIASAARETREQMATMAAENVIAVLTGKKPLNPAY